MMNDKTLLGKYRALVAENKALKEENARLKAKLDETKQWPLKPC
jgi:regulator of replication initiation timing